MMKKTLKLLSVLALGALLAACGTEAKSGKTVKREITVDPVVRDAARFLGGLEVATNSPFAASAASAQYKAWAAGMDGIWKRSQEQNLKKIAGWVATNMNRDFPATVFYPFSGPDILNALAFFPKATDFVLFGLEPAGRLPRPERDNLPRQLGELGRLQNALSEILVLNFFMTLEMEVKVTEGSYSSVAGIMMFFLTRSGMEVTGGRNISIDTNGAIVTNYDPKNPALVPGIEYSFRRPGADELKTVRYFSLDVSDGMLKKKPNFVKFAGKLPAFSAMAKSASFLMHKDFFSTVRGLVLDKSRFVLQDDSGVPLRFFLNADWDVDYYGFYDRPIDLFSNYFQRELLTNMKAKSSGPLSFSYGYDYLKDQSNLILARRKPAATKNDKP